MGPSLSLKPDADIAKKPLRNVNVQRPGHSNPVLSFENGKDEVLRELDFWTLVVVKGRNTLSLRPPHGWATAYVYPCIEYIHRLWTLG